MRPAVLKFPTRTWKFKRRAAIAGRVGKGGLGAGPRALSAIGILKRK